MSYYDHATMMAFRLGPWADGDDAGRQTRCRGRTGPGLNDLAAAVRGLIGGGRPRALSKPRRLPAPPEPIADGDEPRKT